MGQASSLDLRFGGIYILGGEDFCFIICLKQIFLGTTKFGGHKREENCLRMLRLRVGVVYFYCNFFQREMVGKPSMLNFRSDVSVKMHRAKLNDLKDVLWIFIGKSPRKKQRLHETSLRKNPGNNQNRVKLKLRRSAIEIRCLNNGHYVEQHFQAN